MIEALGLSKDYGTTQVECYKGLLTYSLTEGVLPSSQ